MTTSILTKNIHRLNANQLVEKSKFVVSRMTNNPAFPDPTPKLSDVTAAITALEEAITAAVDRGRTAIAIRRARQQDLKLLMDQLGGHVASVAQGNALAILSTGFGVKRMSSPSKELSAPTDLRADISAHHGRVDLRWAPVKKAVAYHVYMSATEPGPNAVWEQVAVSTKASTKVVGLVSARTYWFRVAAIGSLGAGPFSEVAHSLVR
ncbi:MAG: fibronectin type III domain-containing protein [Flavobacteriales bacterium]|nr:fibronectin type III domain-containing protein [Flavobacteriales bacterium]